jgi:hypothetical protein
MPGFVKTPKDEARWSKAKAAASKSKKKDEGSFTDQDWGLVNHIYHMAKAEELEKSIKEFIELSRASSDGMSLAQLQDLLEKARQKMSDEYDPNEPEDDDNEYKDLTEFDPESEDPADRWLAENDPEKQGGEQDEEPTKEDDLYNEYAPGEDEESHQQDPEMDGEQEAGDEGNLETDVGQAAAAGRQSGGPQGIPQEKGKDQTQAQEKVAGPANIKESRFPQPSKEEIADMRQYTRPWEQKARDKSALEAEAHKNPVLHKEGRLVEARNTAHQNRNDAYNAFQSSPEYKNADPISQMEMDDKFHKDYAEKNPDYLQNAVKLHGEAHKKGESAKDIHAAAKDEQIRHVLQGGAQPESPMSLEEGLQHAGGTKGEEGTQGSIAQDKASSFAAGNQGFLKQYAKDYNEKGKKPKDLGDMMNYDEGSRADVSRVLGDHPALKDPKKKAQVDKFFEKYHPLIAMNAHKVLNKLGLDAKKGDIDLGMLHEAGMHGLMQSINDYDHEHPSKASFATHAGNKIRGLQQTALRGQDQIPQELRAGAKKFSQQGAGPVSQQQPKKDLNALISKHPPEVADRMKRIQTNRAVQLPKLTKPEGGGQE